MKICKLWPQTNLSLVDGLHFLTPRISVHERQLERTRVRISSFNLSSKSSVTEKLSSFHSLCFFLLNISLSLSFFSPFPSVDSLIFLKLPHWFLFHFHDPRTQQKKNRSFFPLFTMVTTTPQTQNNPIPSVLIVGNYCHDVLLQGGAVVAETLGGAASFISNVFSGLSVSFHLTSKVGLDFKYPLNYNPIVVPASKTTVFHAYFDLGYSENAHQDRVLKRVEACDPINPSDLTDKRFDFGMAVGVGGEILPETLEKMVEICDAVFVDIQALIRVFEKNGTIKLVGLKESGFYHLLPRVKFIKASSEEALFMDVEEVRQWCCVVVTHGKDGCEVYWKDGEMKIGPFGANQIDPTGAGDSFLGGFVGGLVHGLVVPDAALLGNFFGSLTVAQIGLPRFDLRLLQRVKDEVQRRKLHCTCCFERRDDKLSFSKPPVHEEFHASLSSTKLVSTCSIQECQWDLPRSPRTVEQVIRTQYNGQPKLLVNSVFDEPI